MFRDLLDLVWPMSCAGCGARGRVLCAACTPSGPVRVREVGARGLRVVYVAEFESAARTALLAFKERGRFDLRRPLGSVLARAVAAIAAVGQVDVAVPVPCATSSRRRRGHDHVRAIARCVPLPVLAPLRLVRTVQDSAGLSRHQRSENIAAAMAARPPPRAGLRCVVVDDIVTTGATLLEATRALEEAGWFVVAAATVAGTPLRAGRATADSQTVSAFSLASPAIAV